MKNIGRLLLRLSVGGFFIGHGLQKLFGWFGGHGLDATAAGFESLGMRPGRRNAIAAGVAETAGGAGIALGAATPLAASALTATMLTAINRVHLKNGPWASSGGYEYNVVLIAATLALVDAGPGSLSVDAARGKEHTGLAWTLAALLSGVAGAAAAHFAAESTPGAEAAPVEPLAAEPAAAEPVEPAAVEPVEPAAVEPVEPAAVEPVEPVEPAAVEDAD